MLNGSIKNHVKKAAPAYVILTVIVAVISIISPSFRRARNISNVIAQCSVLSIAAIAQSSVLFIGGIDMSVSSVISFSTISLAMFSTNGAAGLAGSVLLAFAAGAAAGFLNGIGDTRFNMPPIIITISTQVFLKGVCLLLMPSSGGRVNPDFAVFLKTRIGVFNVSSVISLVLFAVFFVIYHYMRFGRSAYAVGSGAAYASQSGIPAKRIIVYTYMLSGVVAALAGIVLSSRIATGNALVGDTYAMDSVAAAVVGGISMNGGSGSIIGSLAGAGVMTLINNVINNMGISPYYQYITKGLVLVLSLLIFSLKRGKRP